MLHSAPPCALEFVGSFSSCISTPKIRTGIRNACRENSSLCVYTKNIDSRRRRFAKMNSENSIRSKAKQHNNNKHTYTTSAILFCWHIQSTTADMCLANLCACLNLAHIWTDGQVNILCSKMCYTIQQNIYQKYSGQ